LSGPPLASPPEKTLNFHVTCGDDLPRVDPFAGETQAKYGVAGKQPKAGGIARRRLDQFEFWTLKEGADGLTRISVRVSSQGQRDSWLVASDEAEAEVLKRWAAEHIEMLGFLPPWARAWF
jgi:hypothetical protein